MRCWVFISVVLVLIVLFLTFANVVTVIFCYVHTSPQWHCEVLICWQHRFYLRMNALPKDHCWKPLLNKDLLRMSVFKDNCWVCKISVFKISTELFCKKYFLWINKYGTNIFQFEWPDNVNMYLSNIVYYITRTMTQFDTPYLEQSPRIPKYQTE